MKKECVIGFIKDFFKELESKEIQYCILRNAEEVEMGNAHDIDMCVAETDLLKFEKVLMDFADMRKWHFHFMSGSPNDHQNIKCYHVSCCNDENKDIYICHFDIFPTFSWKGMVLLSNAQLMEDVNSDTLFHKADPAVEAITKLFIRLLHTGKIKDKYKNDIYFILNQNEDKMKELFSSFMEKDMVQFVTDCASRQEWNAIEKSRNKIIESIKRTARRKTGFWKNQLTYVQYLIDKAFSNTGVFVAFEGTDGSGKSTIIEGLRTTLESTYPDGFIDYYHWRPGVIKKERKSKSGKKIVVTNPHADKPYGKLKSFVKFMFFNMDYIVGYQVKIRWQLAKGHLVVFDRYYYDYFMDKIRYRLDISDSLLLFFMKFIPKPNKTFLLLGDPIVLYNRKKEISIEAITQQIERLKTFQSKFNNSIIINVDKPIENVVYTVGKEILLASEKKRKRA